jgi:hypothetical protein
MDFTIARFPGSVNGIPQIKMGAIFPQIRSFFGGAAGFCLFFLTFSKNAL